MTQVIEARLATQPTLPGCVATVHSMPEELTAEQKEICSQLYEDMYRLMWFLARSVANPDRWQMSIEEIYGALELKLVQIVKQYSDRPYDQLKKIAKQSMRNRITDLKVQCYISHRSAEGAMVDLDAIEDRCDGSDVNPFDIAELVDGMSADAQQLVDIVLHPTTRLAYFTQLSIQRKEMTSSQWTAETTPLILQRTLGWDFVRLRRAWAEVVIKLSLV